MLGVRARGLLSEYRSTLKSLDVEEPIDLGVHRPLAFALAKSAFPTRVTPNQLTVFSMLLGITSGALLFVGQGDLHVASAAMLFMSQIVDCSDGMLARMRHTSSDVGRMLDGVADTITLGSAVVGTVWCMVHAYATPTWLPFVVVFLSALTVQTSSLHTAGYDHYKNVFLRMTVQGSKDGEDLDDAEKRYAAAKERGLPLWGYGAFAIYLGYLKNLRRFLSWFDPNMTPDLKKLPAYSRESAEIYRQHALPLLRVWRGAFGVGSLVFGLSLFIALGHPEFFLAFRLVFLNAIFFFYLWPKQRRASEEAFRAIAKLPPDRV